MPHSRGPLIYVLVVWAAAAAALALFLLVATNTLIRNGRWTSTKAHMEVPVIGAQSYANQTHALHRGTLNLGAWYGYQEVMLVEATEPAAVEADVLLLNNAWLAVMFRDPKVGEFRALRVSRHPGYPAALLHGSDEDGFRRRQPLSWTPAARRWYRLRLELGEETTSMFVDGAHVAELEGLPAETVRVGFRGGFRRVFVDNVVIEDRSGRVFRETFAPRRAALALASSVALALPLVLLSFIGLQRWLDLEPRRLMLYFAMVGTTLAIIGAVLCAYRQLRPPSYPWLTSRLLDEERDERRRYIRDTSKELMKAHGGVRDKDSYRILFLGSSQTFGSGAAFERDTFVSRIERTLNARRDDVTFEGLNGGIPSAVAADLARLYRRRWHKLDPDLLVIDLGNNDKDAERFAVALGEILDRAEKDGIGVVLVAEPNSRETPQRGLPTRHAVMSRLAAERSVPIVQMDDLLSARADEGFLWWDTVHLTSFGDRLFAEELLRRLDDGILPPVPAFADAAAQGIE